ncbi:hypothetical protein [Streptomyces sp. NPDC048332]|uniref:hypothetical protein n=1 Tax=Streptomyces sp. NPDC048332 TaxID=3154619 RepID=UPI003431BDEE
MSARETRAQRLARLAAQVDWSKVTALSTGERYGPEVMAALWAADRVTADRACADLRFAAIGDGSSVSGAAAGILPFLVEAALDPDVTVRFEILRTIADIAGTGNAARSAKADGILEGRWRPTVDEAWPAAWQRAAGELLPLLDDGDHVIRAGAVRALAQSAAHADLLIPRFRARFDEEPDLWSAGCLVLGVGELARHATRRREEAIAWLRHRMAVEGKGPEPDIVEDVDAWLAWDEEIRHDVRLQAVEALCRALPGHADPRYAPVTTAALLASSAATGGPPAECLMPRADVIAEADRRLGADLPGRLTLALALLRHDGTEERAGGLRIAACLMSRWRSAVPALLPAVAERAGDARPENRVLALRILAMCGAAARPWADLVATHLAPAAREPHEPTREHALWALSRMGDDRCVPPLAELLATRGDFIHRSNGSAARGWDRGELDLAEALAPFAAHTDVLLAPLLTRISTSANRRHPYFSLLRQWHRDGADIVPRLIELLDDEATLMVSAHALLQLDSGAVAAAHRERLRQRVGSQDAGRAGGLDRLSPFEYRALTGDGEPARALPHTCDTLGAPEADRLRGMFHAALSRKPKRWSDAPKGAVEGALALWRLTGDVDDVLPALLHLTARSALAVHQTPGSVEALELLAEVAATHPPVAERVAAQLRTTAEARIAHDNRFDAMATVRSLWQLTSDPRQVVPLLLGLVRICPPPGSTDPTVLDPLRLLAEVAAADPASIAPAAPVLRALLAADERPVRHDDWRSVRDDEALCTAARAVLDAG